MITKITAGVRELPLSGRWDTEETVPASGHRAIRLRGSIVGSGTNARAMLRTAQAEFMQVVELCSHSGSIALLHSHMGEEEIRMPARYLGAKQIGDRGMAQAGCIAELEFRCLSRFWLGATVSTSATIASGTCSLTVANGGTAPARPALIVRSAPGYTGAVGIELEDGRTVEWTGLLEPDWAIVFDAATRQTYKLYAPAAATFPACPGISALATSELTDYADWLSTDWGMSDGAIVTVTASPLAAGLTAELVHINHYY